MIYYLSCLGSINKINISSSSNFEEILKKEIFNFYKIRHYRCIRRGEDRIEILIRIKGGEKRKFEKRLQSIGRIMEKNVKYKKKDNKYKEDEDKDRDNKYKEDELINDLIEKVKKDII